MSVNPVQLWFLNFVGAVFFLNGVLVAADLLFDAFKDWPAWAGFPLIVVIGTASAGWAFLVERWASRRAAMRREC